MPKHRVSAARDVIRKALTGSGLAARHTLCFTKASLDTELSGLKGHGLYRLDHQRLHLRSGKVGGAVVPEVNALSPGAFRIDARHGFADPAIKAGFARSIPGAQARGIAAIGVFNSCNAATLGFRAGNLARAGLFAFGAANAAPTVAPVGGHRPIISTNPLQAFA